ncbi:MAG: sulfocyanin-like copper-binding protein [Verrucomicrobiota bacterium]
MGSLAVLWLALPAVRPAAAAMPPPSHWVKSGPRAHRADVLVIASFTKAAGGFNFDGFAKGRLRITVPAGWAVHVDFRNAGPLPHSLMVVPWSTKATATRPKPAFGGAETPLPYRGTLRGGRARFAFTARKPGQYRLICAVPGHDAAGMWDTLIVSRSATRATATA